MALYLNEETVMNLIDRLITKAQTIQLTYGDNVFIISNETGNWTVDGQTFPDLEAAQEYVDSLIPNDAGECTVIIDDLGQFNPDDLKELAAPEDWLDRQKEKNQERMHKEQEEKWLNGPPRKDRRLI